MPATIPVREVHPDLPVDRVWQQGRRLYVRCGRHTPLSTHLHAMGARWDMVERALWVGSGKREALMPLMLDHHARAARATRTREAGHWAAIPYEAELIRVRVKALGGVWIPEHRTWALPTADAQAEVLSLVSEWRAAREPQRQPRRTHARPGRWEFQDYEARLEAAGARERKRRQAAREAASRRRALAAELGRSLTGQLETRREVYPRFTSGQAALEAACRIGQVVRLDQGRRALVTDRTLRYLNDEEAPVHGQEHAHWYAEYQLAVLHPTEAELDTEVARAGRVWDAQELHTLVTDAALLAFPAATDRWTPVPEPEGTITVTTGVSGLVPAGQLILARDGALWWQHPGHYDDYVRSEGCTRDSDLVAAMRDLLAAGHRRRTLPGRPPLTYEVRPDA